MKDIHQIDLIKRIQKDPVPFIGQRSFKLLKAYLIPTSINCEFDIPSADKTFLSRYPSIQDEMSATLNDELGTKGWWSPLKYHCEDERAHFELATNFILDYDNKYPNPNQIDYKLKLKNPTTNYDLQQVWVT